MRRRQFMASAGMIGTASIAGCTGLRGDSNLGLPNEEGADGVTVHQRYETGGDEVLVVSYKADSRWEDTVRLRVLLQQPQDTTVESFRLSMTEEGIGPRTANLYVNPPRAGRYDSAALRRVDDGVEFRVDDTEPSGGGTTTIEFLVEPLTGLEAVRPHRISHDVELSADGLLGSTYVASHHAVLDVDDLLHTA